MATLENTRHELFAQALAQGMTQIDAYEKAGYERSFAHASRLAAAEHVRTRVAELQQRRITAQDEAVTMTVTQGLEELEAARAGAMEAGKFNDAIAATVAKLKTAGLWVERSERTSVRLDPGKLSDEELTARITAAEQDTAGRLQ